MSEDSTEYPGRLIWQSLRRVIGGPTAIEYPAPPLPEQMGFLAPAHQQGDEQGVQREPTAWEEQLYLEIRNAVIVLQSPALHNLLNNDEVDSACTARHTSAIYKSVGERVHPENSAHGTNTRARGDSQRTAIADRHRQQQQQQQQKRIQFGNLGTIEGGMLLPDIPAIDPGRKQVSYAYVPTKKIPRIGLGLGCPRVSEARYFLTEYYTDTKGKSRQGVDDAVQSLIEAALQAGYRLFDTAQMYLNEAILGKALVASATPRSEVFIITKLNDECEEFESLATERIEDWTLQHTVAVHRYVRKTVAEQLERLQTSYIDMYCKYMNSSQCLLFTVHQYTPQVRSTLNFVEHFRKQDAKIIVFIRTAAVVTQWPFFFSASRPLLMYLSSLLPCRFYHTGIDNCDCCCLQAFTTLTCRGTLVCVGLPVIHG